jgi:anti-sigma factor RsiW
VKGKTVQFDSETHLAVQLLLPWYVIHRLNGAEQARVEAHLTDCPRCRADVTWQRKQHATHIAPDTSIEVEHALAASLARIGAAPRRPRPAATRRLQPRRIPWLHWALGIQMVVILGLALLLLVPRPLAGQSGAVPGAAHANLLVAFRSSATEQQIREALQASGAEIIAGPTGNDAYLLKATRRAAALQRLRGDAVITRVEPLNAGTP